MSKNLDPDLGLRKDGFKISFWMPDPDLEKRTRIRNTGCKYLTSGTAGIT